MQRSWCGMFYLHWSTHSRFGENPGVGTAVNLQATCAHFSLADASYTSFTIRQNRCCRQYHEIEALAADSYPERALPRLSKRRWRKSYRPVSSTHMTPRSSPGMSTARLFQLYPYRWARIWESCFGHSTFLRSKLTCYMKLIFLRPVIFSRIFASCGLFIDDQIEKHMLAEQGSCWFWSYVICMKIPFFYVVSRSIAVTR